MCSDAAPEVAGRRIGPRIRIVVEGDRRRARLHNNSRHFISIPTISGPAWRMVDAPATDHAHGAEPELKLAVNA